MPKTFDHSCQLVKRMTWSSSEQDLPVASRWRTRTCAFANDRTSEQASFFRTLPAEVLTSASKKSPLRLSEREASAAKALCTQDQMSAKSAAGQAYDLNSGSSVNCKSTSSAVVRPLPPREALHRQFSGDVGCSFPSTAAS